MADLVTRLLLDSKQFDDGIVKSSRQVQRFQEIGKKVIGMLGKYATAAGLCAAAVEAFKNTVEACQTSLDEYQRTSAAVVSIQKSFWTALNNGNPSRFLTNISAVVDAAREAYDALTKLKNANIFGNAEYAKLEAENEKLSMKVDDKTASEAERKAAAKKIEDNLKRQEEIATTEAQRHINSYKADMKASLAEQGAANASDEEINKYFGTLEKYEAALKRKAKLDKQIAAGTTLVSGGNEGGAWSYEVYSAEAKKILNSREYKLLNGVAGVKREDIEKAKGNEAAAWNIKEQLYTRQHEKQNEKQGLYDEFKVNPAKIDKKDKVKLLQQAIDYHTKEYGIASKFIGKGKALYEEYFSVKKKMYKKNKKELAKIAQEELEYDIEKKAFEQELNENAVSVKIKFDKDKSLAELELERKNIVKRLNNSQSPDEYVKIKAELDAKDADIENFKSGRGLKAPKFTPVKENPIVSPEQITASSDYAESLNQVATAMGSISQMTNEGAAAWLTWGANIMTSVATAIPAITAMIALKKEEAVANAAAEAAKTPIVGWLTVGAAVAAVAAAMFSIPKFATGGIVGGTSYSGDRIIAGVNSGEMILNGAQQRNLFNLISNGSTTSSQVEFKIKGNELVGVLNNYNKKRSNI